MLGDTFLLFSDIVTVFFLKSIIKGLYNGGGDHYTHEHENTAGGIGLDLHDDVGTTLVPVFTENGTYSTYLLTQRAIEIINTHNIDEVCAVKNIYTVLEVVFKNI